MTAKTTVSGVAFDAQGDRNDTDRRDAAMQGFVRDFARTAAIHMESCVRCGMCATACQYYVTTGDPKYTPINKLRPFEQAYHRHVGPFAPLYRLLGIKSNVSIDMLQEWEALLYDACSLCGRCTLACPMGIDISELIKEARHGMYKAGLVPDRLELMDRTTKAWGSPATPADDFSDIIREAGEENGVPVNVDLPKADYVVTTAPAELTEHTKALTDVAKILNKIGASWTYSSAGFEASNIGYINGDVELQEKMTRKMIDNAIAVGAHTLILPECGHAYGAARWEASRWYGREIPLRIIHMTEFLGEVVQSGKIKLKKIGESTSFHDPCQLVRRGGVNDAPRAVLKALGLELKELEDHGALGWCCGGGGGVVSNTRADPLRFKAFELKRKQVEDANAQHFVTACGQCRITLTLGAKHFKWDQKVESLLELVADNLQD
ncbi:(Fe-S)-binding protein [Rhodoblastus sp. 17X3]|uniref:(Fe-S)-binding protein n=1 Tax=Rhodoblastus sp. 17X3 TaxID=3047026 RepID=UPI0024B7C038|nr:(Fe-S)-binding protein [Rhodoblastus sp. 17X3]MDI9848807.1 (Fe-S)-binding protein [Rhodoblastus sp. 17X3]